MSKLPQILVLLVLATLSIGSAVAAELPPRSYISNGFTCSSSGYQKPFVRVNWPRLTSVSGGPESVFFMADLYRYNASTRTWYLYARQPGTSTWSYTNSWSWYNGTANSIGLMPMGGWYSSWYWQLNNNPQFSQGPVFFVPAGYYAVKKYFRWQDGVTYQPLWDSVAGDPYRAQFCYSS
jgi:hypothetical protein